MKRAALWTFYLFSFTLPINQYISTKILVLSCVLCLLFTRLDFSKIINRSGSLFFYFLVLCSGLYYTSNINQGLSVIETSFPILVLPIVVNCLFNVEKDLTDKSFSLFIIGLTLSSIFSLGSAILHYQTEPIVESFYYYELTKFIGFQPTYFAYYLIFGITFTLYKLFAFEPAYKRYYYILLILFFAILLLTGGNTSFIALMLVFSFFLLKFILDKSWNSKKIASAVLIAFILFLFFFKLYENKLDTTEPINDSWERFSIWESTIQATDNLYIGVGTGDYKDVLNFFFEEHNLQEYSQNSLNAHNQLLHLLLSNGLLGVLAFLFMLAIPLYRGMKHQDMFLIITIFPFVVYGITEVFLSRYQGVVFFAWLHQVQLYRLTFGLKQM